MRIFNKFKNTKGWISTWERVIRFRDMIKAEAIKRTEILAFWRKHGIPATLDAFPVKRRTLFLWQQKLKTGGGKLDVLNNQSRAPRKKRQRLWDDRILAELRRLRDEHPNLGKEKLYPELKEFCDSFGLVCPKPRTIGRLIRDLGGLRLFPQKITGTGRVVKVNRRKVPRKPKDFQAQYPGHCIGLDTVEKFLNGRRRYLITAEDLFGRFSFAWGASSHASLAAREFFERFRQLFPFPVTFVLTDNGSEWKKHFAAALLALQITHYHTYPKTPKMNAHVERFNRTIQDEFLDFHLSLLFGDLDRFNSKLMDWLIWYNTKRVHWAFGNQLSPVGFLVSWEQSRLTAECKSGWPHTRTCSDY